MGGSQTFNKALNELKVKKKKPPNVEYGAWLTNEIGKQSTIYVDMSVLIYIIQSQSNIGFDSFFFKGQDNGALIKRYNEALAPYLDPLMLFEKVILVFETGGSRIRKKRSKIVNNGLRNVFLKRFKGSTAIGKRAISRAVGVPTLEIQFLLGASLHDKYGWRYVCSNSTADQLIFQMANAAQAPCYVYSVDQDYIVYSPYVTGLIGPKLKDRFILRRNDILKKLEITYLFGVFVLLVLMM